MDPATETYPGLGAETDEAREAREAANRDFNAVADLIENGDVDGVAAIFARNDAAEMAATQEMQYSPSYFALAAGSGSVEMMELVYTSCRAGGGNLTYCDRNSGSSPLMIAIRVGHADLVRWCFSDGRLTPDSNLYGHYSGRGIEEAWRERPAIFQALVECTSYTAIAREYAKCSEEERSAEFAAWLSERAPLAGVLPGGSGI